MSEDRSPPGDAPDVDAEGTKDIGLLGAVAIGVGTMIAAGIFVLSGLAVSKVGTVAIVSFLLAALAASLTAAAYAEFASIYAESGGGYLYVAETFDTDLTYVVGWTMILGYPASAAFYLASFSEWFSRFLYPLADVPAVVPSWLPGLAVLAGLVVLNYRGTEESNRFQIGVTALKVVLIVVFLYGGLRTFQTGVVVDSFRRHVDAFAQIGVTSALVFITFFGFSAIATNAEEIEEPGRTIPRAIYASMGFVTVVYALVVLVIVLAINSGPFLTFLAEQSAEVAARSGAPGFIATHGEVAMAFASQFYLGDLGFYVIVVGALFSMLSAANATVLAGSRVKLALARRGHLPTGFDDLHPDSGTPHKAVLLTGGIIATYIVVFTVLFGREHALFGITLGIEETAKFANALLIGGLSAVNVAVIYSRRRDPDADRGFTVPLVPWVPILGVLANLVLLINVGATALLIALVAEGIGVLAWFTVVSGASGEEAGAETPTVAAERHPADRDHLTLAVIEDPGDVRQLMNTAAAVAEDAGGEVLATSVVTLPRQTPLHRWREYADDELGVLERATDLGEDAPVPVSGTVRVAHDRGEAVLNAVREHDPDVTLLGWERGRGSRRRDVLFGTTVDDVLEGAEGDVLVEKVGETAGDVESILVPTSGGPHTELAAETGEAIASAEDARIELARVVPPDASEGDRAAAREALDETAATLDDVDDVEEEVLPGEDAAETIAERTGRHAITVLGASREGPLGQLVFGDVPAAVARRTEGTLLVAKRNAGLPSRLGRFLPWGS